MNITRFDTLDSTQLHARREIEAGRGPTEPVAFIAEQQAGGVGRRGRAWSSPRGGVWMTVVFPVRRLPASGLALAMGNAVCEACEAAAQNVGAAIQARLKWPNDVIVNDRKLAGLLIEVAGAAPKRFLLAGVGINANVDLAQLAPGVGTIAMSLQSAIGKPVDMPKLIDGTISAMQRALEAFGADPSGSLLRAGTRLWGVGRTAPITLATGERVLGILRGMSPTGELIADVNGELRRIASAEVGLESDHQVPRLFPKRAI